MNDLQSSRAVLAALRQLQEKVRRLEDERTQAVEEVRTLKEELAQRQDDFKHTQELQNLTIQEESVASRLSYERLLAEKRAVDIQIEEIEVVNRELQGTCETARNRGQDAQATQLAAEKKCSILEGRVKECKQMARARQDEYLQARKTARRETTKAGSQLSSLARRVEALRHMLEDERASRQRAEKRHNQTQTTTTRTSRYLESILTVNQELVGTTTGISEPPGLPDRPFTQSRDGTRTVLNGPSGEPSAGRSLSPNRMPERLLDGVDVAAAVKDALRVKRAGGDPIPSLTALYERIGFCAMQDEDDEGGTQSLPTSPTRAAVSSTHKEYRLQNSDDEFYCRRRREPTGSNRHKFFPMDGPEEFGSPQHWESELHLSEDVIERDYGGDKQRIGTRTAGGGTKKGYSFAHSPAANVVSLAERSPEVLERLESLESQLEQERADMEKGYKDVVLKASPGARGVGNGAKLDARALTKAISRLQDKSRQLEVVRESLRAFKASQQPTPVTSPVACRRKVAALNVLQGLCHGIVGGEKGRLSAA